MARFFQPSQNQNVDFVYNLPTPFLAGAMDKVDSNVEHFNEGIQAYKNQLLTLNSLPLENEKAKQLVNSWDEKVTQLSQAMSKDPMNWSKYKSQLSDLSYELKKDMVMGEWGNISKNYNQYQGMLKSLDATDKEGNRIVPLAQREGLLNAAVKGYSTPDANGRYTFNPIQAAKYVDIDKKIVDQLGKEFNPNEFSSTKDNINGGWIVTNKSTGKVVDANRVRNTITSFLQGDTEINDYLRQAGQYNFGKSFYDENGNPVPLAQNISVPTADGKGNQEIVNYNPNHPYSNYLNFGVGKYATTSTTNEQSLKANPFALANQQQQFHIDNTTTDYFDKKRLMELENGWKVDAADKIQELKVRMWEATNNKSLGMGGKNGANTENIPQQIFVGDELNPQEMIQNGLPVINRQISDATLKLNAANNPIDKEKAQAELNAALLYKNTAQGFLNSVMADAINNLPSTSSYKDVNGDTKSIKYGDTHKNLFLGYIKYLQDQNTSGKKIVDNEDTRKQYFASKTGLDLSTQNVSVYDANREIMVPDVTYKNPNQYNDYLAWNNLVTRGMEKMTDVSKNHTESTMVNISSIHIPQGSNAYNILQQSLMQGHLTPVNPDVFYSRRQGGSNPAILTKDIPTRHTWVWNDDVPVTDFAKYMQSVGATNLSDVADDVQVVTSTGQGIQVKMKLKDGNTKNTNNGWVSMIISGTSLQGDFINELKKDKNPDVKLKAEYLNDVNGTDLINKVLSLPLYAPKDGSWSNSVPISSGNSNYLIRKNINETYGVSNNGGLSYTPFRSKEEMMDAVVKDHVDNK